VRYRHYLPELAKKPQAVHQVAPELVAELFSRLWDLLEPAAWSCLNVSFCA